MPNATTPESQDSVAATENQAPETSSSEVQPSEQLDNSIPEKFIGKSAMEIIQAYNNLEKSYSKSTSERSQERQKREELEERIRAIESRPTPQQQYVQPSQPTQEKDPFAIYEEEFETNPKEAIKNVVNRTRDSLIAENNRRQMEAEALESRSYHLKQKQENPEYAKLEPTMQQLAVEFSDLVRPERGSSTKVLKLLHLAARGMKADEIASEAARRAKEEQTTLKQEKRQAFSEGAGSKGDSGKRFEDLSLDEMEKFLGKVRL